MKKMLKEFYENVIRCGNCERGLFQASKVEDEIKLLCNHCGREYKEEKQVKKVKCSECRNCHLDFKKCYCKLDNKEIDTKDIGEEIECVHFKSKYIQYPITVSKIDIKDREGYQEGFMPVGSLVKIRPCGDEKTYLGILLGEIDIGMFVSHNPETKVLSVSRHFNPAIFVPDLKKVVFGCSSWWGRIKSESELKEITNDDIDNAWYVKALKDLCKEEEDN